MHGTSNTLVLQPEDKGLIPNLLRLIVVHGLIRSNIDV